MYKLYKIRNPKTGLFYLTCSPIYSRVGNSHEITDFHWKFTTFEKSKSYTKKGNANTVINRFVRQGAAVRGLLGSILLDKTILELVEYDVHETVK